MEHSHRKAVVIAPFWAAILTVIVASAVIGSYAYAWSSNASMAVMQEKVNKLDDAKIDQRLVALEQVTIALNSATSRIEHKQDKMDDKIDQLLVEKRK